MAQGFFIFLTSLEKDLKSDISIIFAFDLPISKQNFLSFESFLKVESFLLLSFSFFFLEIHSPFLSLIIIFFCDYIVF